MLTGRLRKFAEFPQLAALKIWLEKQETGTLLEIPGCQCSRSQEIYRTLFCCGHVIINGTYWPTVEREMITR